MRISVIGSGAIGTIVAGYLVEKDIDVTLAGRAKDVAAIKARGLVIDGVRGHKTVPLKAVELLKDPTDLTVLAVKTQDITEAVSRNRTVITGKPIVSVQNGLRAEELLADVMPPEGIISSIVMFGSTYLKPGKVVHNFEGDWIIGKMSGPHDAGFEAIGEVLAKAFPIHKTDRIKGMKWLKLFLNLNNCLPAITGESIQETYARTELSKIGMRIWREALEIIDTAGIKLESLPDFPEERLRGLAGMKIDEASQIYSGIMSGLSKEPLYGSVLQSLKRGRLSEIDYINGEIARLGDKIGAPAPLNKKVTALVHQVEKTGKFLTPEAVTEECGRI